MTPDIFPRLLLSCALCCAPFAAQTQGTPGPNPSQENPAFLTTDLQGQIASAPQARHPDGQPPIAQSDDGAWIAAYDPGAGGLVIRATSDPTLVQTVQIKALPPLPSEARLSVSASRQSFVLVPQGQAALFEIFYGANPPQFGFAHDWRIEGPVAQAQRFPVRKITLKSPLHDLFLDPSGEYVLGLDLAGQIRVTDLVIGQQVAQVPLPAEIRLLDHSLLRSGSGLTFAFAHQNAPGLSLIQAQTWTHQSLQTGPAPLSQLIGHPTSPWLWALTTGADQPASVLLIDTERGGTSQAYALPQGAKATGLSYSPTGDSVLLWLAQTDPAGILYPADGHSAPAMLTSAALETLLKDWDATTKPFGTGR